MLRIDRPDLRATTVFLGAVAACGCAFARPAGADGAAAGPGIVAASPPATVDVAHLLTDLSAWDAATSALRRAAAEAVAARETDFKLVRLETFTCGGRTHEVAIWSHAKTGLEFALVPAGTFTMGSPETEPDRGDDETQHAVTLKRPFLISRTECTQGSWDLVGGADGRKWRGAGLPIESASWEECSAWCTKAGLELPTEAQWEWACRAGTTTRWSFGDDETRLGGAAWFRSNADKRTHPVAQKSSNAFGLFDMHGNVKEWCADWHDEYPTRAVTEPAGPPSGRVTDSDGLQIDAARVCRGGWFCGSSEFPVKATRSAARSLCRPNRRNPQIGFRPVRPVAP